MKDEMQTAIRRARGIASDRYLTPYEVDAIHAIADALENRALPDPPPDAPRIIIEQQAQQIAFLQDALERLESAPPDEPKYYPVCACGRAGVEDGESVCGWCRIDQKRAREQVANGEAAPPDEPSPSEPEVDKALRVLELCREYESDNGFGAIANELDAVAELLKRLTRARSPYPTGQQQAITDEMVERAAFAMHQIYFEGEPYSAPSAKNRWEKKARIGLTAALAPPTTPRGTENKDG